MRAFLGVSAGLLLVVSAAAAQDPGAGAQVRGWFQRYLGREPDPTGYYTWTNALQQGMAPARVLSKILGSDEFYAQAGSTPEGFVQAVFVRRMGRAPTPREVEYWARRVYGAGAEAAAYEMILRFPPAPPPGPSYVPTYGGR